MKVTKVEEETEEKEKEDVVKGMEKKTSDTLKQKRSFFVRMVSDPKLYNPKIVKVYKDIFALIGQSYKCFSVGGSQTEAFQYGCHV